MANGQDDEFIGRMKAETDKDPFIFVSLLEVASATLTSPTTSTSPPLT